MKCITDKKFSYRKSSQVKYSSRKDKKNSEFNKSVTKI